MDALVETRPAVEAPPGSATDFDFFAGFWRTSHHRMVGRLVGSTTWEDFDGTCVVTPLMAGHANVDDNVINLPAGPYRAATIRLFNAERRAWSIYWVDGRSIGMDPTPMVGGFEDGRGFFYADEEIGGQMVRVRFLWTVHDADHCQWEQAFSIDGGFDWETNWITRFERVG